MVEEEVKVIENMEDLLLMDINPALEQANFSKAGKPTITIVDEEAIFNFPPTFTKEEVEESEDFNISKVMRESPTFKQYKPKFKNTRFDWQNWNKQKEAKQVAPKQEVVVAAKEELLEVSFEEAYRNRKVLEVPTYDGKSNAQEYFLNRMFYDNPKHAFVVIDHLSKDNRIKSFRRPMKSINNYKHYFSKEELQGNLHVVPNTFIFNKKNADGTRNTAKSMQNVHFLNSFYVDCDIYNLGIPLDSAIQMIDRIIQENQLPKPSMTVHSGGGIYLFWKVAAVANNHASILYHFNSIQDILCKLFKEVGADSQAKDAVHMFKLAGTHNLKYDEKPLVSLLNVSEEPLEFWDFVEQLKEFYPVKEKKTYTIKKKSNHNKGKGNNLKTLYEGIKHDFLFIDKERGSLKGNRNYVSFVLAAYMKSLRYSDEKIKQELLDFNSQLTEPQPENELFNIDWHKPSQYNNRWKFSIPTMVKKLSINKDLQAQLKVLKVLTVEEKRENDRLRKAKRYQEDVEYRENKKTMEKKKYNEKEEVISKRQLKEKRDNLILILKEKGITQAAIVTELKENYDLEVSLSTVRRVWNKQ